MGHRAKWPWWGMGRGTVVGPGSPGGGWVRCRWSWWGMGQVQVVVGAGGHGVGLDPSLAVTHCGPVTRVAPGL